jgi:long-chain acyl-CoA synthetase
LLAYINIHLMETAMKYEPATIIDVLEKGMTRYPTESLIISTKRDGKWIETDVASFRQQIRDFALGLYSLGVRTGDKVSLHSENSTEWVICDQAILSLGAVNVPIYTTQPGDQIKYILENSDTKVHIVSNDDLFADTKPLMKSIKNIKAVISILGSRHDKLKSYDAVLKMGQKLQEEKPNLLDELKSEIQPDDLATLIYTSGTTGTPKGVMLTHNNIASNIQASLERVPFTMKEVKGQNVLSYLPLSHVFERMITYMYLCMGAKIHYIENVEEIRDDFIYVKPFFFATVPRLLEKIQTGIKIRGQEFSGIKKNLYYWAVYLAEEYDPEQPPKGLGAIKHKIADKVVYSKVRELFGGNLRGMISGGAALSPGIFRFINALGVYCGQGYGLTETSPVISVQDPDHMRVGSSGLAITDVEIKIADDNEILARGPNIMKGYYNEPEMTREVMTDDGWFKSGDVGKIDEDGYLYITDRKKSLFKLSTGKYVAPQNIENKLINSGFIEQAVVIGYQRKYCSALIAPDYGNVNKRLARDGYVAEKPYQDDEKIIELIQKEVDAVNETLSPWETVKKFKLLEKPLSIQADELTPTLKVKRPVVLERYKEEIESLYPD